MPLYEPPGAEDLQGDIYRDLPSTFVEELPVRAARLFETRRDGRQIWSVHVDGENAPRGGFRWRMEQGGEEAQLVHGYVGLAIVLSHDCEIENDPTTRTLALIRPADHLDEDTREKLFAGGEVWTAFPLEAQDEEPQMQRCFIDFRRITTVRPAVLQHAVKVATLSEELRKAMARRFWDYLFRRIEPEEAE